MGGGSQKMTLYVTEGKEGQRHPKIDVVNYAALYNVPVPLGSVRVLCNHIGGRGTNMIIYDY